MAAAPVTGNVNATVSGQITAYRGDMLQDPSRYKVNVPQTMEYIKQPLYSYQLYPAAGSSSLGFFQSQAGGTVTREFTNMELQGQLPSPQMFLIEGIGVDYLPGMTTAAPVQSIATTSSAAGQSNDLYAIMRAGVLSLTIGSKQYFQMAPLMSLPPRSHFEADYAVTSTIATTEVKMDAAHVAGPVFRTVPILLESSQNFNVTIAFPGGVVTTGSTDALAKIGVILYGTLYRPAQ